MKKNRRDFIKLTGLAGATSLIPIHTALTGGDFSENATNSCVLIPSETAGPFPLDLTDNTAFFRQDVRESKTGVQLNLKLRIIGMENCAPMQNLRVNIWHCDKDGQYSGYSVGGNPGQAGLTYLRGYQLTDANGEVEFITIFPGWYTGRICHIHFQVYVSSSYAAISQLTFDIETKNAIYAANPTLYTKGADPRTFANDNIFSDGYAYQLATLTPNSATGGYDSFMEVAVQGSGVVGLGHIEKENARHFVLGQNVPNPYLDETAIPFTLKHPGDVTIDLWDLSGKKVATVAQKGMGPGEHRIPLNMRSLGLPTGNYAYQFEVANSMGVFRECKMMTAGRG
jgi:protocatechuate 3,4-dioxygenase beta subunit